MLLVLWLDVVVAQPHPTHTTPMASIVAGYTYHMLYVKFGKGFFVSIQILKVKKISPQKNKFYSI